MRTAAPLAISLSVLLSAAASPRRAAPHPPYLALAAPQAAPAAAPQPAFDAATIKPPNPKAGGQLAGFYGQPGGRIFFGGTVKMLVQMAFNLQRYQVTGGPQWSGSQWFEINAVPPDNSPSRQIKVANANPTPDQRLMLQSFLRDRFGFKFHFASKQGEVYLLIRGKKPLQLKPPKDPAADPRAIVLAKTSGFDGEAIGTNTTLDYFAQRLGGYLRLPVLNHTGMTARYDFYLAPDDPENQDVVAAVFDVVNRLGLKLKRGRGPVQVIVIDQVQEPSPN